jgi:uncharacterized membrane protein YcaP (DUF421 family)
MEPVFRAIGCYLLRLDEGVERLDQIKHATLERSGAISIIAKECEDEGEGSGGG